MTDYVELRRLAEAATPGEWPIGIPVTVHEYVSRWIGIPHSQGAYHVELRDNDAAYIAAMHPQTTLALLDRLARAEAIIQELHGKLEVRTQSDAYQYYREPARLQSIDREDV